MTIEKLDNPYKIKKIQDKSESEFEKTEKTESTYMRVIEEWKKSCLKTQSKNL